MLSQPIVNTPSAATRKNARKRFISIPFQKTVVTPSPAGTIPARSSRTKKADVAEHPKAFRHVGLLVNEPPGKAELLFI
jgi:hypothetical protein